MQTWRYVITMIIAGVLAASSAVSAAQSTAADQAIQRAQRLIRRQAWDAAAYYRLGDAYLQKARESGDITSITLAEQALGKSLQLAPESSGAARHLAYALYMRHAFVEAAAQAQQALALDPSDSHAYGILGDAYLEVGNYEAARQAYQRMMQPDGDLYAYSRQSGLKSLHGDTAGAMADLRQAINLGQAHSRPSESLAWAMWQLGNESLALGDLSTAEASYRQALDTFPDYYRALAGLGQVRAAQQRYAEAIDFYRQAIAVVPLPDYAAALGDIYTRLGQREEAQRAYELVEYIGYLNTLNQVLYNRELAYFYADHDRKLTAALDLAGRELEVRQDIYAFDLLAWTLYKNQRPTEALAAIKTALRLGTRDARLFFHAGMIYHRLGQDGLAAEYLRRALTTNPHFHVLQAEVAQRTLHAIDTAASVTAGQGTSDVR